MTEELKPCPFCGGEAHTYKNQLWHVACEHALHGCVTMSAFATESEAVKAWNARTDDQGQAAAYWRRMYEETVLERTCHNLEHAYGEFECSNCGFWADFGNDLQNVTHCPGCGAEVWQ